MSIMDSMRLILITILAVSSLSCLHARAGDPPDLIRSGVSSDEAMAHLRSGAILIENIDTSESGGSVRVQALVNGDMNRLWFFLASCDSAFYYVEGLKKCEVRSVEHTDIADITQLAQSVKKSWIIPRMDYVIEVRRQPMTRVDFELVEGDLKAMRGGWRFLPLEGEEQFLITHEIRVRPSFPVPRWLIRRSMRKDLPDMLACLRGLVDGSVQVDRLEDLERCPNKKWKKNLP